MDAMSLCGKVPDKLLARMLGVAYQSAWAKRNKLNIPLCKKSFSYWDEQFVYDWCRLDFDVLKLATKYSFSEAVTRTKLIQLGLFSEEKPHVTEVVESIELFSLPTKPNLTDYKTFLKLWEKCKDIEEVENTFNMTRAQIVKTIEFLKQQGLKVTTWEEKATINWAEMKHYHKVLLTSLGKPNVYMEEQVEAV